MSHFADRLLQAIERKGSPICVGLDPVLERLPESLRGGVSPGRGEDAISAIEAWCNEVLRIVAPAVPCVKIQSACFERYLWPGIRTYQRLVAEARALGMIVIGDVKRGDIGASSDHYAAGCLADPPYTDLGPVTGPDAVTVNPYMGADALEPFVGVAREQNKGVFALVRTSNPGGDRIQTLKTTDGPTVADRVAELIAETGDAADLIGSRGYSLLGAVVGATVPADAARLRKLMPRQIFLVPGFGAQGGGADDVRACFNSDGLGAIVTASRSVIYAHEKQDAADWRSAIEQAVRDMAGQVRAIVP